MGEERGPDMSARMRLAIDALLFAAFVAAYYPLKTGLAVHEWLCLIVIIPSFVHLVVNWDWAQRVATSLLGRLRSATRLNFAVDSLLLLSVVTVMLSGFVVSRVIGGLLGYQASLFPIWHRVHSLSAEATIVLALVHLGLHWRWVARVLKTRVFVGFGDADLPDDLVLAPTGGTRDGWQYTRFPRPVVLPGRVSDAPRGVPRSARAVTRAVSPGPAGPPGPRGAVVLTGASAPIRDVVSTSPNPSPSASPRASRREESHDA